MYKVINTILVQAGSRKMQCNQVSTDLVWHSNPHRQIRASNILSDYGQYFEFMHDTSLILKQSGV